MYLQTSSVQRRRSHLIISRVQNFARPIAELQEEVSVTVNLRGNLRFQNAELYRGRNSALAEVAEAEAEVLEALEEEDVEML